jgi:AcrR family transcriptional regulator
MSPRPYRLGQRQQAADETRTRILSAAQQLLETEDSFSLDAVAHRADVARMTVYHQFGSKGGLLEALFGQLAARGGMERLPSAFQQSDVLSALDRFIDVFAQFWSTYRVVMRRLRAFAVLDPELNQALADRNEWRRQGIQAILAKHPVAARRRGAANDQLVDVLFALTSFEYFDVLAGPNRPVDHVAPLVRQAARAIVSPALDQVRSGSAPRRRAR